jgi:hypothetical protein
VKSYYYFIAQLPYLLYEQKPPMSSNNFKALAASLLDENDAKVMQYLSFDSVFLKDKSCSSEFVNDWKNWECALRLNLAKERALKLKREVQTPEPPFFPQEAAIAASKAADEKSPLDGEILLDKARWNAIDTISGNENFSVNRIYAYYLKLLLLERRQAFNAESGFVEYKTLYASILESAQNSPGEPK